MEQENFQELFINEAQFVDWGNQIVDIDISYWNDANMEMCKLNLSADDEDQFMTIGTIIQSLNKLPIIKDLQIELNHITLPDLRDY